MPSRSHPSLIDNRMIFAEDYKSWSPLWSFLGKENFLKLKLEGGYRGYVTLSRDIKTGVVGYQQWRAVLLQCSA